MIKKKPWIAYVGPFLFPWGQAGSRRVYGMAQSLADCGFRVIVGAGQQGSPGQNMACNSPDLIYESLGEIPNASIGVPGKLYQLLLSSGARTVDWLDAKPTRPSYVVAYGAGAAFMHRVGAWCKRNDIPLIVDVVEWYDGTHMNGGYFGPFHINAKLAMHYYYPKCDGVIAISELLAEHYRHKGCNVVRVPPSLDVSLMPGLQGLDNRIDSETRLIRIVYAGTPGKKDLLSNVIRAITLVDPLGQLFELQVLGPTSLQLEHLLAGAQLPSFVRAEGPVAQELIPKYLQEADFTVFIREPKRFAHAGFPTKFVESLANGVPVIANLTSDLGLYLRDGVEGIVCPSHTVGGVADALMRACQMSRDRRLQMRVAARQQAEMSFDYREHVTVLTEFLARVRA
jgi:glycosyltransferase involved in cell wall biosynthesis